MCLQPCQIQFVNNYGNLVNDPNVPYGSTWVNAALDPAVEPYRKGSVKSWFWGQMVTQSPDIQAKMVLFWHNHFAIQFLEIPDARACYVYTKVLYTHALGNFKDLTRAVTIDPAMLFYLNGRLNTKKPLMRTMLANYKNYLLWAKDRTASSPKTM